jgi:hypothetical protein
VLLLLPLTLLRWLPQQTRWRWAQAACVAMMRWWQPQQPKKCRLLHSECKQAE